MKKYLIISKIIAIILMIFPIMILGLVFTSLYLHFISGYPIPKDVGWSLNLAFNSIISLILIIISVQLFRRKSYARILASIAFFIISVLNIRAELFLADSPSIPSLIFNSLFFICGLYLLFSKNMRKIFAK